MTRVLIISVLAVIVCWLLLRWIIANPSSARFEPETRVNADIEKLRKDVTWLAQQDPPRDHQHPETLAAICKQLAGRLAGCGFDVTQQRYDVGSINYGNVIARYGDPENPLVVIGAHIDVCGPYPGADDNASGVAAIMEMARLIGVNRPVLNHTLELVVFNLEEPPYFRSEFMGSAHYVQSLLDSKRNVSLMVALDCIGFFSDRQSYPFPGMGLWYGPKGDFITVVGHLGNRSTTDQARFLMRAGGGKVHSINAPRRLPGIDFSDHLNFWNKGIDAVLISDTAFYRNDHYHQPTDTPETLDYHALAQVTQGLYYLAVNWAPTHQANN